MKCLTQNFIVVLYFLSEREREMKMSNKKFYMVLDTETTTTARAPFDIAYTIIDRKGNIVEQKNYLVADIFNSPLGQHILMHDDFSKNKMYKYVEMMQNGLEEIDLSCQQDTGVQCYMQFYILQVIKILQKKI